MPVPKNSIRIKTPRFAFEGSPDSITWTSTSVLYTHDYFFLPSGETIQLDIPQDVGWERISVGTNSKIVTSLRSFLELHEIPIQSYTHRDDRRKLGIVFVTVILGISLSAFLPNVLNVLLLASLWWMVLGKDKNRQSRRSENWCRFLTVVATGMVLHLEFRNLILTSAGTVLTAIVVLLLPSSRSVI